MIKKSILLYIVTISFVFLGCVTQQKSEKKAVDVKEHGHTYPYIQSFGEQKYHAAMNYDSQAGMLEIIFVTITEEPLPLLKSRRVKALLVLPNGERREFYFYNLQESAYYFHSYDYSERDSDRLIANDTIFAKKDWLRYLSSFKLTVWIPLDEINYVLNYSYEGSDGISKHQ